MPRFIARLSIGTVLFALFALLVISPPAQAAFPGANGKIAFVRILTPAPDDFDYEIFTMSPDGTGITNLTNTPGETDDAALPRLVARRQQDRVQPQLR